jgi:hypothetical protein
MYTLNLAQDILYFNDFEDDPIGTYTVENLKADWNSPSWDDGVTEGRVEVMEGPEAFEGKSLRCRYPANTLDMNQWQYHFDQSYDEMYSSFRIKFADDFDFVRGGKVPGMAGGAANAGGNVPDGTDGFGGIMMWRPDGMIVQYVYHPDQPGQWGEDFDWNIGGQRYFEPGTWHHIENRIVINTPGEHDGIIQGWLDGELALDVRDFRFRDVTDFAVDLFFFQTHFGGGDPSWEPQKDEFIYFDNFFVSTGYMGPASKTGERRIAPESILKVNQTSSHLNIFVEKTAGEHEVLVFDISGRVLVVRKGSGSQQYRLDKRRLGGEMCFIRLRNGGKEYIQKIIIEL